MGSSPRLSRWSPYRACKASGGEVQHKTPAYTAGFQALVCGRGLFGRQDVSDPQSQCSIFDLLD
jgi:hypothetical protein